ncbi:peptidoglycan-binding protein [bacterium RCC_150]
MYQQEYRHGGIGAMNAATVINSGLTTLTRHKAAIAAWALVAVVVLMAVVTQDYAQATAAAGSGTSSRAVGPVAVLPVPTPGTSARSTVPATVVPPGPAATASGPAPAEAAAPTAAVPAAAPPALAAPPAPIAPATPVAAPAPVAPPSPVAPAARTISVAGSGGQAAVDSCIGPIHFTPTDAYSLFITEHDFCGGWARFSDIDVGETVNIVGYGTYTVTGRGQVPQGGTTNNVAAVFGGFPRAILQTCIPGTNQMLVIGLN